MSHSSRFPLPTDGPSPSVTLAASEAYDLQQQQEEQQGTLRSLRSQREHRLNHLKKKKSMLDEMTASLQHKAAEIKKEEAEHASLMAIFTARRLNIHYAESLLEMNKHFDRDHTSQRSSISDKENTDTTSKKLGYSVEQSIAEQLKYYPIPDLGLSVYQEKNNNTHKNNAQNQLQSNMQVPETIEDFLHKLSCYVNQIAALLDLLDHKGDNDPIIGAKAIEIFEKGMAQLYAATLIKNRNLIWQYVASLKTPSDYTDKEFKAIVKEKMKPTAEQIEKIKEIYTKFESDIAQINEECNAVLRSIHVQGLFSIDTTAAAATINNTTNGDGEGHATSQGGGTTHNNNNNALLQPNQLSMLDSTTLQQTMLGYILLAEMIGELATFQDRLFAAVLKLSDSMEFSLTPIQRCRFVALDPSIMVDYIKVCQLLADDTI
jgi:hypothetical protein